MVGRRWESDEPRLMKDRSEGRRGAEPAWLTRPKAGRLPAHFISSGPIPTLGRPVAALSVRVATCDRITPDHAVFKHTKSPALCSDFSCPSNSKLPLFFLERTNNQTPSPMRMNIARLDSITSVSDYYMDTSPGPANLDVTAARKTSPQR